MPGGVSLYKSLVQDLILTPLLKNEVGQGNVERIHLKQKKTIKKSSRGHFAY